jgi:hypothetical protein
MVAMSSAGGLLALLDEQDEKLQAHALRSLLKIVDVAWAEVSSSVSRIEAFAEDDSFAQHELASLLASKVGAPAHSRRAAAARSPPRAAAACSLRAALLDSPSCESAAAAAASPLRVCHCF